MSGWWIHRYIAAMTVAVLVQAAAGQTQQAPPTARRAPPLAHAAAAQKPTVSPAQALRLSGNSLLRATLARTEDPTQAKLSAVSFFAVPEPEPRVLKKHDLVTIIVREESEFTSEGTTETKKEATFDAGLNEWPQINLGNGTITASTNEALRLDADGEREFTGEGTVERTDSFITRIAAHVVDVKPNGNLVLEARKEIQTDDEIQKMVLTGTCRAEDVTADNSVLSTQLHDLTVRKTHTGEVRNAGRKGWIPKIVDIINPF